MCTDIPRLKDDEKLPKMLFSIMTVSESMALPLDFNVYTHKGVFTTSNFKFVVQYHDEYRC